MTERFMLHKTSLPEKVIMGECWARDGLQNETKIVPTPDKVEIISRMFAAGVKRLEAVSFAHPKILPQFADAEEVLKRIPRDDTVQYRGICTTMKAVERAIASKDEGYGVDEIVMVISATEEHNMANVGMDHVTNKALIEDMVKLAKKTGHKVFGWVLTSFGCPIRGDVPLQDVSEMGKWWIDQGIDYLGFGDTTGVANPLQVSRFYDYILGEGFNRDMVVIHFHDTRGWGIANSLTALTYGFTLFDTSLGAIGGQPQTGAAMYHTGFSGNTCTEDLVGMFEEMNIDTGIDIEKMIAAGKRAEKILGRRLRSNFINAGPVPHGGILYDKEKGILT
ncbi:MAG: hydroxymethylglutaryl-CoA lyase [Desulforhopalus sp.]